MIPYPSIDSLWKRDTSTGKLNLGSLRVPAWRDVGLWYLTEKVDGTNLRVILGWNPEEGHFVHVRGRTDRADLPKDLVQNVKDLFLSREGLFQALEISGDTPRTYTFYGEGYGPKIQKNGHLYRSDKGFILFDLRQGNAERGFWWDSAPRDELAAEFDIPTVPVVGALTSVYEAPHSVEAMQRILPHSFVAEQERDAEGVVARPHHELQDAHGNRIMWKLTYRDLPTEEDAHE